MKIGIVRDRLCEKHKNAPVHPERPERLQAIDRMIGSSPDAGYFIEIASRDALDAELESVHTRKYVETIRQTASRSHTHLDADTGANAHTWSAAVRSAGMALSGLEAVLDRRVPSAFAMTRPPGHHAEADHAMGFCIFNNIAIAARSALGKGLTRVAIVDWDVHHGNGTQRTFYDSAEVLYISLHQYPHYPGTGTIEEIGGGAGVGYTMNVPLQSGQGDFEYAQLFAHLVCPVLAEFAPQLVLVSAGFDAHEDDPLAGMRLSAASYSDMTRALLCTSASTAVAVGNPVPLLFILEGGYNLAALASGVSAVLRTLASHNESTASGPEDSCAAPDSNYIERVESRVRSALCDYWECLRSD
ncbi:MAG TPA: histone deacetylase [Spirochaetia bacterium]|nr:histone deacetylase [Spirochaetia bacterium]